MGLAEAADVVYLPHSLERLPEFFSVSRSAVRTAWQNIFLFAGLFNATAVLCAATGRIGPVGAAVTHQLSSFLVMMNSLRLLHYPPVMAPVSEGQLGAGVHTDYGNVTLLATDAVGGLMVQDRSGRWLDAPVIPNTFVCNIGDCLMRWSNDVYVSTPHKEFVEIATQLY